MPEANRSNRIILIFSIVAILFALGVVKLFLMRFEVGDVYPPYSSLRADPLGARALYESYEYLPGISVARNFAPLEQLKSDNPNTIFFLGEKTQSLVSVPESIVENLESMITEGGRVVLAMYPERSASFDRGEDDCDCPQEEGEGEEEGEKTVEGSGKANEPEAESEQKAQLDNDPDSDPDADSGPENDPDNSSTKPGNLPAKKEKEDREPAQVSMFERWGFDVKAGKSMSLVDHVSSDNSEDGPAMPLVLDWHTGLSFELDHEDWQIVYAAEERPVVAFRQFGQGSIVLIADSYPMSNEALMENGDTRFLAWLAGSGDTVIFDESHFGIQQQQGIASLIRKYQLSWFLAGLFAITLLLIWKHSVSFIPPTNLDDGHYDKDEGTAFDHRGSQDHAAGLVSMLHRHIAPEDVLSVSLAEWRKSAPAARMISDERLARIQTVVAEENTLHKNVTDPIRGYRKICQILSEEK